MKLENKNFSNFVGLLKVASNMVSDIMIRDSVIRQRSNNRVFTLEADVNDILGSKVNMNLAEAKTKCDLLSMFIGDNPVSIDITDKWYIISDNSSRLEMRAPADEIMKTKIIDKQLLIDLFDNKPKILSYILNETLVNRIKKSIILLSNINGIIEFKDGVAKLTIKGQNKSTSIDIVNMQYNTAALDRESLVVKINLEAIDLGDVTTNILDLHLIDDSKIGIVVTKEIHSVPVKIYQQMMYT